MSALKIIFPTFEIKNDSTKSYWCCDIHKNKYFEIETVYTADLFDRDILEIIAPSQVNKHISIINNNYKTSMKKLKDDMKKCIELKEIKE